LQRALWASFRALEEFSRLTGKGWQDLHENHRVAWQGVEDELAEMEARLSEDAMTELVGEYLGRVERLLNLYLPRGATQKIKIETIR
jgi:hypothetical protein